MREILFRGKGDPDGAWLEGYLVSPKHIGNWVECHPIKPETVGQFTGMTDKNGTKIFEGDIAHCKRTFCDGKEMVGHINYSDGCFCIKDIKSANNPAMQLCGDFVVVGNIYDTPELLEDTE